MSTWRLAKGLACNPLTEKVFAKAYVKWSLRNRQHETKFLKMLIQCGESGHIEIRDAIRAREEAKSQNNHMKGTR